MASASKGRRKAVPVRLSPTGKRPAADFRAKGKTMAEKLNFNVEVRERTGKGGAREARRNKMVFENDEF